MYGADVPLVTYEMLQGLSLAILAISVVVPSVAIIVWVAERNHFAFLLLKLGAFWLALSLLLLIKQ